MRRNVTLIGLSRAAAAERVRTLATDSSNIVWVDECSRGAWEQRVSYRQMIRCLEDGEVITDPRQESGNWVFRMSRLSAGQEICIEVALVLVDGPYLAIRKMCETSN